MRYVRQQQKHERYIMGGSSRADIDIKRSSRTLLCHFDKLEGQREQPGDSVNLSL